MGVFSEDVGWLAFFLWRSPSGFEKDGKMCKAPRNHKVRGRARREARVPVVATVHELLLLQEGRGVEEGVALLGFGSALREESLLVLQRHPDFTPGLPHVRLIATEGGLRPAHAPPRAVLCEGGPLGKRQAPSRPRARDRRA